jgi:Mrp family chromosome partitioning ATPase
LKKALRAINLIMEDMNSSDMKEAPHGCPGVASESAGKESACQGCPNQGICSTGQVNRGPDPDVIEITRKMSQVKNIILVLSGKGGVGKSTVSTNIARSLALDASISVGLLDIDICGPSIAMTTGLEGESIHMSSSGWSPVFLEDNLAVMSCAFLLDSADSAVIWRGPKKNGLIKQFLRDVDWNLLDYLIIDTPPGTSDEHLSIVSFLKNCDSLRGAIIVSTPQEVSIMDVRKQIDFCQKVKLPIIGLIENMSGFVCPSCSKESTIFKANINSIEKLSSDKSIPILGKIPLDPRIAKSCDDGSSCFELFPDSPAVMVMNDITSDLKTKFCT